MKRRDLKILWSSNGPHTNSGYGVETRDLLYRFLEDGWNVACNSFWGVQGYPVVLHGQNLIKNTDRFKGLELKCYPSMDNPFGADGLLAHGQNFGADVVFTMQDVWTIDTNVLKQLKMWIPYCPIDKDPVPAGVLEKLQYAYRIITFSEFGKRALQKAGFTSTLILEGTDTNILTPLNKEETRKEMGIPNDVFIFGMIAANKENPPRKGFQEALEAFKMFCDKHPEARLFIHSQQTSPTSFPVVQYAQHLGVSDKLIMVNPYSAIWGSDSYSINKEMNCFDILLHPSQTEGFGLTAVESQSAGIPAIVNNCHSMPELVIDGKTGFICQTDHPRWSNDNSYVYPANVDSLYEQMEKAFKLVKEKPEKTAKACRDHVKSKFNIDILYETGWKPMLEKIQDEILPVENKDVKLEPSGK